MAAEIWKVEYTVSKDGDIYEWFTFEYSTRKHEREIRKAAIECAKAAQASDPFVKILVERVVHYHTVRETIWPEEE